jgi:hypothetical protein
VAKAQTASQQAGLTRGKAVLIGVLAVVFVGILFIQYRRMFGAKSAPSMEATSTSAETPRTPRSATKKKEVAQAESDLETEAALMEFDQAKWRSPELPMVLAYDPFARPETFPKPPRTVGDPSLASAETQGVSAEEEAKRKADELEQLRSQYEDLKQRGVHVIVSQGDEWVAMIGDRLIHVGDDINGFTVTKIDPVDGTVDIEKKPAK